MNLSVAGLLYRPHWPESVYITRRFGQLVRTGPGPNNRVPWTPTEEDEAATDWEVLR
jgi:hypothetical protein